MLKQKYGKTKRGKNEQGNCNRYKHDIHIDGKIHGQMGFGVDTGNGDFGYTLRFILYDHSARI